MASPLESQIKDAIAAGFKGLLKTGTLRRETINDSPGVDSYGDPVAPTVTTYSFEGIRDSFSAFYAAGAGIPETDVKILIIAGLIDVEPVVGDKIFIESQWHEVRRVLEIDPAGASYTLQAFKTAAP